MPVAVVVLMTAVACDGRPPRPGGGGATGGSQLGSGNHPEAIVDREHMGAPLDVDQPFSTDPTSPVPGVSFTDPDTIPFWWERGALTAWQVVPLTLATVEERGLWETELFKPYKPLADVAGGDPAVARQLAYALRCQINAARPRDAMDRDRGARAAADLAACREHLAIRSRRDAEPSCGRAGGERHRRVCSGLRRRRWR